MFLENASRKGWIEVICGSMFSGKTEELIRRLKRAKFANQKVEIFKPRIDVRYSEEEVVSHDANAIRSTPVDSARARTAFMPPRCWLRPLPKQAAGSARCGTKSRRNTVPPRWRNTIFISAAPKGRASSSC